MKIEELKGQMGSISCATEKEKTEAINILKSNGYIPFYAHRANSEGLNISISKNNDYYVTIDLYVNPVISAATFISANTPAESK